MHRCQSRLMERAVDRDVSDDAGSADRKAGHRRAAADHGRGREVTDRGCREVADEQLERLINRLHTLRGVAPMLAFDGLTDEELQEWPVGSARSNAPRAEDSRPRRCRQRTTRLCD